MLNCKEFVNADEIAKGLSPFQPETVSFEAGRIMLNRINELLEQENDFAFETTLSSLTYQHTIKKAQEKGYFVTLIFLWLESVALAKERVKIRVRQGGHSIPEDVIERRYKRGLKNYFEIYMNLCDSSMLFQSSIENLIFVLRKRHNSKIEILHKTIYQQIIQSI
jgi:predicted ABC-type ATPase